MATNLPAYKLTLYKPRTEDATEVTVLTPIGGAAHSDEFIVTTIQGVTGAQPYLEHPQGRQGSFDPVTRKLSTGNLKVTVFDKRTTVGGSNAYRWVTAFIGTTAGQPRLKGCKAKLERSLDNGATWADYFTGRVRDVELDGVLRISFDLKDSADELNRPIFTGVPDPGITYAGMAAMLPVGPPIAFGPLPATVRLTGTLTRDYVSGTGQTGGRIDFDQTQSAALNLITNSVHDFSGAVPRRVVCTSGITGTLNWPSRWIHPEVAVPFGLATHYRYKLIYVEDIPGDPAFVAIPAGATPISFYVTIDQPPTKELPLLINDIHPVQLWADIIDGKFSLSTGYTTLRPLGTRDSTALAGHPWFDLISDPSFGLKRFIIDKSWKANDFIEQCICLPYGLGASIDASGRVTPFDMRRTASRTTVATLTDADLIAGQEPTWSDSRDGAITGVEYNYSNDRQILDDEITNLTEAYPDLPPTLIRTSPLTIFVVNDLSTLRDVGEKIVKITALGSRIGDGELDAQGQDRAATLSKDIQADIADFLAPFQSGTLKMKATYRVSSAGSVAVGQFVSADHSKLPNVASNLRGGARLGLVIGRSEQGGAVTLDLLDYGSAATAAVPAITAVAVDANDPNSINVTVTANAAGDQVAIWAAVTETSIGAAPAATADAWTQVGLITGSGVVRCGPFPRGKRIWFRARSQAIGSTASAPSAYVFPTPGYLDLAALTAPTSLVSSNLFANRVDLAWTLGDATLDEELFQTLGTAPGTWTDAMKIRGMLPGTTRRRVTDLATSTQYTFGVRVRDWTGGVSSMATLTLTTSAVLGTAPRPAGIGVVTSGLAP